MPSSEQHKVSGLLLCQKLAGAAMACSILMASPAWDWQARLVVR